MKLLMVSIVTTLMLLSCSVTEQQAGTNTKIAAAEKFAKEHLASDKHIAQAKLINLSLPAAYAQYSDHLPTHDRDNQPTSDYKQFAEKYTKGMSNELHIDDIHNARIKALVQVFSDQELDVLSQLDDEQFKLWWRCTNKLDTRKSHADLPPEVVEHFEPENTEFTKAESDFMASMPAAGVSAMDKWDQYFAAFNRNIAPEWERAFNKVFSLLRSETMKQASQ